MSASGVLLTYEKQMIDWREGANRVVLSADESRLSVAGLAVAARRVLPADTTFDLTRGDDPALPVVASIGRDRLLLHPVSGAVLADQSAGMRAFMATVRDWHRRLGGDVGSLRAAVVAAANLLFVLLLASGIFLWLPPVWRWQLLRLRMILKKNHDNARMRDFNWHHVLGAWMLMPLLLIAVSGVVFSYPWANQLVYAAHGEAVAQRRAPSPLPAGIVAETPTAGQRTRRWLRFIHTGEVYGIAGQTVAGLASLAASLLALTGLAMAWRRLIAPLRRSRPMTVFQTGSG